jgi:hypothetical protein
VCAPADDHDNWSRRKFLGVAGAVGGAASLPGWLWLPRAAAAGATPATLTGKLPIRTAMHVHGSWSEGAGSWQAQYDQANANAIDVMYMTDHDYRAMGLYYATSLVGATWLFSSTGSFAQHATTVNGGSIRVLAESSSSTAGATATMALNPDVANWAFNRLRTGISGTVLTQKIASASLTNGAKYELVVLLSYHPATGGRPAGQYRLVYRFCGPAGRWTEDGGLTGVVRAPAPTSGSSQVLDLTADVAKIWPDMVAIDHCLFGFAFNAISKNRGSVADITVDSLTITRKRASAAAIIADQKAIVAAYAPDYPNVKAHRQTEVSLSEPHMNTFGMAQWLPDYSTLSADHDTRYLQIVNQVHGMGGIISYNHPFGDEMGPLLSASDRITKRRQLFQSMNATHAFGCDILEVGYAVRGQVDAATHIGLWDTFSRNGNWLTGNGVSDDHSGQGWGTMTNGFITGLWAATRSDADLATALRSGRAFTAHLGQYPNAQIDLVVDGTVRMGKISVSSKTSRQLTIFAANVPAGCTVQLICGPVDYSANTDPGTSVVRSFAPSALTNGKVTVSVGTSTDCFYRVQVVTSVGDVIGTSNPVWLLRQAPAAGIPAARQ